MSFNDLYRSIANLAERRGITSIRDCSVNPRRDRRVYRLGEQLIAKLYGPEAADRHLRERMFLELGFPTRRCPELVEASFDVAVGGYIVMTSLPGRPLADLYQDLSPTDYAKIMADLGESIAAIHSVPLAGASLVASTLQSERIQHFDSFDDVVERLRRQDFLPENSIAPLGHVVKRAREAAFKSPRRFLHGDVHDANIFVTRSSGEWNCALIDFEESGPNCMELEFVRPFISVLAETFPARRFAQAHEPIWRSFGAGYSSGGWALPDIDLIAGHAIAWCLWVSADSLKRGHPKARAFAATALDALALHCRQRPIILA